MRARGQEYIGQDTTVVHGTHDAGGPVKSPFRTPPGIPSGLDPGTPEDRDAATGAAELTRRRALARRPASEPAASRRGAARRLAGRTALSARAAA